VVRTLLQHSAKDVRMRLDSSGSAPLFCAIEAGNLNVCRELLSDQPEEQVRYEPNILIDLLLEQLCFKGTYTKLRRVGRL
jgi:hypothetical protein